MQRTPSPSHVQGSRPTISPTGLGCRHAEELTSWALTSVPAQSGWEVEACVVDWHVDITQPVGGRPKVGIWEEEGSIL